MTATTPDSDGDLDALDIATVCRRSGLGRSFIYQAISRGELRARKFGRLTRILLPDYRRWLDSAPPIEPASAAAADARHRGGGR